MTRTTSLAAAAGLLLPILATSAFASDPFLGFGHLTGDSIERARQAYLSLENNPFIASVLRDGQHTLSLAQRQSDAGVETHKFQDYYRGLEVVGSMAMLHQGAFARQVTDRLARFDLDVKPSLTADQAVALALAAQGDQKLISAPELKILPAEDGSNTARLVYWVRLESASGSMIESGADVVIDAHTGETVLSLPHHQEIADIEVYQASDRCQTVDEDGNPEELNYPNCNHTVVAGRISASADASARQAASNAKLVLDYYLNHHGRDSYDDQGSSSISIVHVGEKFANAFWNSAMNVMAYGDGDGVEMGDLTRAVDVAGHEMTHGVVSQTAQLLYASQSGALNEAYADIFGKWIANDGDWMIGRKVFLPGSGRAGIRDLANPASLQACETKDPTTHKCTKKRAYPATYADRFVATGACDRVMNDNCFVHINSTIWSHGAYNVIQTIGRDKAEKIYYLALTQYLTSRATFSVARDQTLVACSQLYDRATCDQVRNALAQVGL